MTMKNKFTTICLFLFLLLPCWLFGDNVISQLMSGDSLEVQRSKEYLYSHYSTVSESQRQEYVKGLILIIDSPDTVGDTMKDHYRYAHGSKTILTPTDISRTAAIDIVGQLRITEALPILAKHLNYMTPQPDAPPLEISIGYGPPYVSSYPCAQTMTLMGDTAIPYLEKVLKSHQDKATRFLAGRTILTIKGDYYDLTPIKNMLKQSTDSTEQERLNDFIRHGMAKGGVHDWM